MDNQDNKKDLKMVKNWKTHTDTLVFEKKPAYVEAMRVNRANYHKLEKWCDSNIRIYIEITRAKPDFVHGKIRTNTGWADFDQGDWIICSKEGEFYPCSNATIEKSFNQVKD